MTAPTGEVDPVDERPADGRRHGGERRLDWTRIELAWPAAIAIGFASTLVGVGLGVPLLPALLATLGFAPLFLRLSGAGRPTATALATAAWLFGIAAGIAAVAHQLAPERVLDALPLARSFAASDLAFLGPGDPVAGPEASATWWRDPLLLLLVAATARLLRGVPALLLVGVLGGAAGAGALRWAPPSVGPGESLPLAALAGWPWVPALFLLAAAAAIGALAPGAPGAGSAPLPAQPRAASGRRGLLAAALALGLVAALARPWLEPLWRSRLPG